MTIWHDMWEQNSLGFHRDDHNPLLLKHWPEVSTHIPYQKKPTILLPLCGKSHDILWLMQQGYTVFGIELVEIAIRSFFYENNLQLHKNNLSIAKRSFPLWCSEGIILCQADLFDLPKNSSTATCFYDRAALVALPPSGQEAYVKQLITLAPQLTSGLLITIEFQSHSNSSPPYSTPPEQVQYLYNPWFHVKLLCCKECPAPPSIQMQGVTTAKEYAYMLTIK